MLESLVECRPRRQSQETIVAWVANLLVHPRLVEIIIDAQWLDSFVQEIRGKLEAGEVPYFPLALMVGKGMICAYICLVRRK